MQEKTRKCVYETTDGPPVLHMDLNKELNQSVTEGRTDVRTDGRTRVTLYVPSTYVVGQKKLEP